jgi:hypothetical protein
MVFTSNIENEILSRPVPGASLAIVSGYISPYAVKQLEKRLITANVVYGLFKNDGVPKAQHDEYLRLIASSKGAVQVRYSAACEIHSKLYVWHTKGTVHRAMVGSANFTYSGLCTPGRELLVDVDSAELVSAYKIVESAIAASKHCADKSLASGIYVPKIEFGQLKTVRAGIAATVKYGAIDLAPNNKVQQRSGLNWGFASANVSMDDAYLPISVGLIRSTQGLIQPRAPQGNRPVELVWDDGTVMTGQFEGSQPINGASYPKQLASHPIKSVMGKYIRKRLKIPSGTQIGLNHLLAYGRTQIGVGVLHDGVYFLDFSV